MWALPWRQIEACLNLVPEWEFKQGYHVTQSGILAASAFGGLKDVRVTDLLAPWARLEEMEKAGVRLTLKGQQAADFRLALRQHLVSQRMLNYFIET